MCSMGLHDQQGKSRFIWVELAQLYDSSGAVLIIPNYFGHLLLSDMTVYMCYNMCMLMILQVRQAVHHVRQ